MHSASSKPKAIRAGSLDVFTLMVKPKKRHTVLQFEKTCGIKHEYMNATPYQPRNYRPKTSAQDGALAIELIPGLEQKDAVLI